MFNVLQAIAAVLGTVFWVSVASVIGLAARRVPLWLARHAWAPTMLAINGVRIQVEGLEHVARTRSQVFVANHASTIDIPVVFRVLPVPLRFILKKELAWVLPVGFFAWLTRMIFVDRRNPEKARIALRKVAALGRRGGSIMAFPEGTRSRGRGLLPFKKGVFVAAIQAGLPVVPVAIHGAEHVLPSDSIAARPGVVRVAIGRPIPTAGMRLEQRGALADEAHAAVAALLDELAGRG